MGIHRKTFSDDELVRIDTSNCVVLNSGGPLMQLICIEGDNALVSWDGERALLPVACLSKLVRVVEQQKGEQ